MRWGREMRYTTQHTYRDRQNWATLEPSASGDLVLGSTFDRAFVDAFKSEVPSTARKWDPDAKRWLVATQYGDCVRDLVLTHLGVRLAPVVRVTGGAVPETRIVRLEYLGAAKDRGNNDVSAFGYCNGDWSVVVPLQVLRAWFEPDAQTRPGESPTLYGVLGVSKTATQDEVRTAYRRAARTWHPDCNKEPDAHEQFLCIKHAYDILSDTLMRKKYNAGLAFAATSGYSVAQRITTETTYRPPLRCGYVLAEGVPSLGRFNVSKILAWEDILNEHGRAMVTSWPLGGTTFEVRWV